MMRLAVIASHPVQYNSPWFRFLAVNQFPELKVFYLWDGGVNARFDAGFGIAVSWNVPLLEGYDYEFVPNRARWSGPQSLLGLNNPELAHQVGAFHPDAILLFGYNYLSHYRFLLSRIGCRIPLIFRGDSHRLIRRDGLKEWARRYWIGRIFGRFSAFLYVGQANRAYFVYHGVEEKRLFLCPHAVDNERFFSQTNRAIRAAAEWKTELGIKASERIVLFAGKFEHKKRSRDLVAAFRMAGLKDVTLVLVGNGAQEEDLRKDAAGDPRIVMAPFQNQAEMPRTYMLADLFVLPSYGNSETWGLAVNEAMCMARPVIVSDHVGCAQDLVRPYRNGLIFPAGDVAALATALREAFSDMSRLKGWGDYGKDIIKSYGYEQATQGLMSALKFSKRHPTSEGRCRNNAAQSR